MTTLAEVNASLGVTNIALSDVAKEQKETNKGISKFVEFMQDKDTRDRREDIEEKRERKASVISSVGAGAGAIGSGAVNLGKKGFGLGKDLFSKLGSVIPVGLAGVFLTSLLGVSEKNPFSLLSESGRDCTGALALFSYGEKKSLL